MSEEIAEDFATMSFNDVPIHSYLKPMIEAFVASGAADKYCLTELGSGDEGQFWAVPIDPETKEMGQAYQN